MSQYIVCRVSNQLFAISILDTNRIISLTEVTKVPDTPSYIMGVMASEGEVLPVVDLSNRFFNHEIETDGTAQIIIVHWQEKAVGIAVDEVIAIKDFDEALIDRDLEKVTALIPESDYTPIQSIIQTENGLVLEVDSENIFDGAGTLEVEALISHYEEYLKEQEKAAAAMEENELDEENVQVEEAQEEFENGLHEEHVEV